MRRLLGISQLDDVYDSARMRAPVKTRLALRAEFYEPSRLRIERVVYADADIFAGEYLRAALADDYLPDIDLLTVGALDAEVLRI